MRALLERLPAIAKARRTTLICGPTGSGKEVVARALHRSGERTETPYVPVHCGAIPENLLEAELFGHTRGAFTGATTPRAGLIRSSAGGTLFLDEIDSLPLSAQVKLLRFLETGELRSVGSDRTERVDTWVIAATNGDLGESVRRRDFRADLMYRLDVIRIELPPLRMRGSDIELLAHHFLSATAGSPKAFSDDALAAIHQHDWPGNVRELKHRVERAALMSEGAQVSAAALGLTAHNPSPDEPIPDEPRDLGRMLWSLIEEDGLTLGQAVERCERVLIQAALRSEDNNRTRAAQRLGIHTRTIFKKLRG
jgi:DNA-binding NtrC family response regulator